MEGAVIDVHHPHLSQAHFELAAAQSYSSSPSSTFEDIIGLSKNSTKSPISCFFSELCHDSLGWGPVDKHFSFTPCFVGGIVANVPTLVALVFVSYQLYSYILKKPQSNRINSHLIVKLVSDFGFI